MYLYVAIVIMAVVTYLLRVLPLTLFKKKVRSVYIRSFLHYVPYAVLGAMTFPHIFYATDNSLYAGIGTLAAIVLGYFGRSLLTVAVLSVGIVYFCNVFF